MKKKPSTPPQDSSQERFDPVALGRLVFPNPREADDYGLVAIGGDYRPEMLLAAYANGIFPWPSDELPFSWFSPDPRLILRPMDFHTSRSLRKTLKSRRFTTTFDQDFEAVIDGCAAAPRAGDVGTWIVDELRRGFLELHQLGFAHSVEVWDGDRLAGGLYGLSLGAMFCGESMFHRESNASKVALWALCRQTAEWGFELIDCQVHTDHLESLGAMECSRHEFLDALDFALQAPTRQGSWSDEDSPAPSPTH